VDEFFGRYRNLSVFLAVVFAQIILLGYQVRTDRGSRLLREWTVQAVTPVTKSVRGLTQWAGSGWENYFWLIDTKQDNDRLRRQLAQLKLENVGLRSSLAQFEREDKLVAYQDDLASKTLLAQVIGKGANSNSREIFISRGLDAGVTAGMPVITPDGIVGKVQASFSGAALVMLISDPEAGVGVLLERSRAGGILKGTGHTECRVDYISHEVEVALGETVYTSGDDRVFPKGLRIGEVVKLDRGTDFQEIRIKPFVRLDRLEEVLVITAGIHQQLPDSPQVQPPQFLMPLPAEEGDPLRTGAAPAAETPALAEGTAHPAQPGSIGQIESNGRLTDADRLRQYYQSIAAQQGHRIGYGAPGTPAPEFNPERVRPRPSAAGGRAAPGNGSAADAGGGSGTGSTSGSATVSGGTPRASAGAPEAAEPAAQPPLADSAGSEESGQPRGEPSPRPLVGDSGPGRNGSAPAAEPRRQRRGAASVDTGSSGVSGPPPAGSGNRSAVPEPRPAVPEQRPAAPGDRSSAPQVKPAAPKPPETKPPETKPPETKPPETKRAAQP
jgi:rod shape-determining protein MreC